MANNKVEYIGEQVMANWAKRRQFIEAMTPAWTREGAELRKMREGLKISRAELSKHTKVSTSVYARLEKGQPIKRREAVVQTFKTMLRCIPLMRKQDAGLVK